jgi:hypothetical protein
LVNTMLQQPSHRTALEDCAPRAILHIRKLGGASQPSIVMAGKLAFYVVKFREFMGVHSLTKEAIGSELMSRMGLPVPKWNSVLVADAFIDQNQALWYRNGSASAGVRPKAGLHFGSQLTVSEGANRTYEVIPSSWSDRVVNRDDFVGALLFDLWANNCDRRQCVFTTNDGARTLHAVFIDNDHLFGGYCGNEETCTCRAMVPNPRFYRGVWNPSSVARWKTVIDGISDHCIDKIVGKVPKPWIDDTMRRFVKALLKRRRRKLPSLIEEADRVFISGRRASPEVLRCVTL